MEHFEMVEKLRQRANVSYEQAKAALEATDWDILDALVLLETEGKIKQEEAPVYSTKVERETTSNTTERERNFTFDKSGAKKAGNWLQRMINKSLTIKLHILYRGNQLFELPLLVIILACLLSLQVVTIGLIIAMFFGWRYRLSGVATDSVNELLDKAGDTVDQVKQKTGENKE